LDWLYAVELVVEKLVVAPVGGWSGGERERGKLQKQGQWELVFC
jgi:hypothetical protein